MLNFPKTRIFRREERGLAAVEFALILPILITMLFGMCEVSLALFARNDITQIASTVSDLVAQNSTITSSDLANVYNAANSIMYPYYTGSTDPNDSGSKKASIRVTSINYDASSADPNWIGKVNWTCSQTGTGTYAAAAPVANNAYTIPKPSGTVQPMLAVGGSVILTEVAYSYASPTSQAIAGSINMTDKFYTKPRRVGQIPKPASC